MKLLVTGGCGFIGCNFIKMLLAEGKHEVVNLDKLTYAGRKENLAEAEGNKNYSFVKGDICSKEDALKAMEGAEGVVNFAAESHVDRSIAGSDEFIRTNIFGVHNLLECARETGVKRFLQVGTDEVYGSVEKGESTEESLLKPRNPYSASKAAADLLAQSYCFTHGMDVVVTRSSNNFGPNQFPEKVVPLFITNILREKKVPLYGDGLNERDWLYVGDNCNGIMKVLEKGRKGEIYNIGAGNLVKNAELTKKILGLSGKGEEMIEYVEDRPGHDRRYSMSSKKISEELGWSPEKGFGEGLKETVEWYTENREWWQALVK